MNQQPQTPATKPDNKPGRLTVGYAHTDKPGVRVPNLRLCGRWLHEAGFVIGRHVRIEADDARLTIEKSIDMLLWTSAPNAGSSGAEVRDIRNEKGANPKV